MILYLVGPFKAFVYSLPFFHESNTAMGILMKAYLSKTDDPKQNLQSVIEEFPNCVDIPGDLQESFSFWTEVISVCLPPHLVFAHYRSLRVTSTPLFTASRCDSHSPRRKGYLLRTTKRV